MTKNSKLLVFNSQVFLWIVSCGLGVFLTGCSLPADLPLSGSGSVRDLLHTASGYVIEGTKQAAATIELGKMGYEKAKSAAGDVQERVENVQKGIESVKEGREMIEKGIGTR